MLKRGPIKRHQLNCDIYIYIYMYIYIYISHWSNFQPKLWLADDYMLAKKTLQNNWVSFNAEKQLCVHLNEVLHL